VDFLKKLQNKPEHVKKTIVLGITIAVAVIFVVLWLYYSYTKVKSFNNERFIEQLNPPDFSEDLREMEEDQEEVFKSVEDSMEEAKSAFPEDLTDEELQELLESEEQ
jgi:flagellar biosynthesis/type III secretory pathway M-ring protein FliF/YscJ